MKAGFITFLSLILLLIPETFGKSFKPNVTFKNWSAKIGQTGSLTDINVFGKNVITFSPFIIAFPIDEKSGQRKRVFEFLKNENSALEKTEITRQDAPDKVLVETKGEISIANEPLISYEKTLSATEAGVITIKYTLEFLETRKYDHFIFPTYLGLASHDKPYTMSGVLGENISSVFPLKFLNGKVKELLIDVEGKQMGINSSSNLVWSVEDARKYGDKVIKLNMTFDWFKKGMTIEKGRKETFEITIKLPLEKAKASTEDNTPRNNSPGVLINTTDTYKNGFNKANPLFFNELCQKRWWNDEWKFRKPFLISETIGKPRLFIPVNLQLSLPAGVEETSIRVVTAGSVVVPSQTKAVGSDKNLIDVTFQVCLSPGENLPLFVYYGNANAKKSVSNNAIFKMIDGKDTITVHNSCISVEFLKTPLNNGCLVRSLKLFNGNNRNQIRNFMDAEVSTGFALDAKGLTLSAVEDGAVYKTLTYSNSDVTLKFKLFDNSRNVFYEISKKNKGKINIATACLPAGDLTNDKCFYSALDGIREFPVNGIGYNRKSIELDKYIKAGWVSLSDANGDSLGFVFDLNDTNFKVYQHEAAHFAIMDIAVSNKGTKGAMVAAPGGFTSVRDAYIDWKSPPEVIETSLQNKDQVSIPEVPEIGRDFINVVYPVKVDNYPLTTANIDKVCQELVDSIIGMEANYFIVSARMIYDFYWESEIFKNSEPGNQFYKKLVEQAHRKGIGIVIENDLPKRQPPSWYKKRYESLRYKLPEKGNLWGCPVGDLDFWVENAKDIAKTGADYVYMLDEYGCSNYGEKFKTGFKDKYGMDYTEKFDYNKLKSPEMYNNTFYKSEIITSLVKALSHAVKETNPKSNILTVSAPALNFFSLENGYHDLEAQADYLNCVGADYYTTDLDALMFAHKFCRGATGNNKPLWTWVGWSHFAEGVNDPDYFRKQTYFHILTGANNSTFAGIALSEPDLPQTALVMKKVTRLFDYTGLGKLIAESKPYKFMAVFRDRDAFFDSVKNGECKGKYQLTDYDKRVAQAVQTPNIPSDIITAKFFTLKNLAEYKILVIPDSRVLSENIIRVIKEYVANGGIAIIQGASVEKFYNKAMKVTSDPEMLEVKWNIPEAKEHLNNNEVVDSTVELANGSAEILAQSSKGKVLINRAKYGKGEIICYATRNKFPGLKYVIQTVGNTPLTIADGLRSNLFMKNGGSGEFILGVCNPSLQETYSGSVNLNFLKGKKIKVVSVMDGEELEINNDSCKLTIPPDQVYFYILTQNDKMGIPEHGRSIGQSQFSAYSSEEGMKFLYQKKTSAVNTASLNSKLKDPKLRYVGIFNLGGATNLSGYKGINEALKAYEKYITTSYISNLDIDTLEYFDAVVIPTVPFSPNAQIGRSFIENLRDYVKNGGGVMLIHNSIGPRGALSSAVFPEIGSISSRSVLRNIKVTEEHPIISGKDFKKFCGWATYDPSLNVLFQKAQIAKGDIIRSAYNDHMEIAPGKDGSIIGRSLTEKGENYTPAIVAGTFGKGKVVLSGLGLGFSSADQNKTIEKAPVDGELALLVNSIFWLANNKKE